MSIPFRLISCPWTTKGSPATESYVDHHFGNCPECGRTYGYVNIGKAHWFYCRDHKTMWCVGANVFSSWRHETADDQRHAYEELGMEDYREVEPREVREPLRERIRCWFHRRFHAVKQYIELEKVSDIPF